jgi:hypothetical protein
MTQSEGSFTLDRTSLVAFPENAGPRGFGAGRVNE